MASTRIFIKYKRKHFQKAIKARGNVRVLIANDEPGSGDRSCSYDLVRRIVGGDRWDEKTSWCNIGARKNRTVWHCMISRGQQPQRLLEQYSRLFWPTMSCLQYLWYRKLNKVSCNIFPHSTFRCKGIGILLGLANWSAMSNPVLLFESRLSYQTTHRLGRSNLWTHMYGSSKITNWKHTSLHKILLQRAFFCRVSIHRP